jgi:hypothetical protein
MLWILFGLAVGIALGLGRLRELGDALDSLITSLVLYVGEFLQAGVRLLDVWPSIQGPLQVLSIGLSVATPGVLVATLVLLVRASARLRRIIAGILVVGGMLSFGFVDLFTAVALVVAALVVASAARLITGPIVVMPLVAIATLTAYRYSALMLSGNDPVIAAASIDLLEILPWLDPALCRLALIILGVAPFFAAGSALLANDADSEPDS